MSKISAHIKRDLLTGVITVLPITVSLFVLWVLVKMFSGIAAPVMQPLIKRVTGGESVLIAHTASFFFTIIFIWIVGIIATHFIGKSVIQFVEENILLKLPILNTIYDAVSKFIKYIFVGTKDFKSVVVVPFPTETSFAIGFATGETEVGEKKSLVSVFIPTTPNPTTGFLLLVPKKDVTNLEISVDEAVKMIVSGGILVPPNFKSVRNK